MDKQELTRLKELAEKATRGEWITGAHRHDPASVVLLPTKDSWVACIAQCQIRVNGYNNAAYIAAANPQAILELIVDYERLEKENEEVRANNYGPEILNDPAALTESYFAGRMAEGREKNREMDKLLEENRQLEKEADWLANKLVAATKMLANATGMETDDLNEAGWRKVAREAVESSNG